MDKVGRREWKEKARRKREILRAIVPGEGRTEWTPAALFWAIRKERTRHAQQHRNGLRRIARRHRSGAA